MDKIDSNLAGLIIGVLFFVVGRASFQVARSTQYVDNDSSRFAVLQTSAFALASLLLGFSFSVCANRFEIRRDILVREANAIGTTALQAGLLDDRSAKAERALLREYLAERIDSARSDFDSPERALAERRSAAVQQRMWNLVENAARNDPQSRLVPVLVQSLNLTIDASAEQSAASRAALPNFILVILVVIVLVAAAFTGLEFARSDRRAVVSLAFFAVIVGLVFAAILDLNDPQHALIKLDIAPLQTLQQTPQLRG